MGPLSGLFVAPFIGVLSDRCTSRFGRRRPFILLGAIFSIVGMTIFANALRLTNGDLFMARLLAVLSFGLLDFATNVIMFPSRALLGDLLPGSQQHAAQSAAAAVASIGEICAGAYIYSWKDAITHVGKIFVVAGICMAASCTISLIVCKETPITNVPSNDAGDSGLERNLSTSSSVEMVSIGGGGGKRGGGVIVAIDPSMKDKLDETMTESNFTLDDEGPDEDVEILHHRETIADEDDDNTETHPSSSTLSNNDKKFNTNNNTHNENDNPPSISQQQRQQSPSLQPSYSSLRSELLTSLRSAIVNFPRPLIRVGIVYGLAWFVWFASLPFYSHWIGVDVLHGDPNATDLTSDAALAYQLGVRVFAVANMVKAVVALIFAASYPNIIAWVGNVGERVVFSTSFFIFSIILFKFADTNNVFIAAMVIALGSVPFIVTQTIPIAIVVQKYPDNLASNLGVMNLFCVSAQLIDTLYTGKVAEWAGESVVLKVAACWGFATAAAALFFL